MIVDHRRAVGIRVVTALTVAGSLLAACTGTTSTPLAPTPTVPAATPPATAEPTPATTAEPTPAATASPSPEATLSSSPQPPTASPAPPSPSPAAVVFPLEITDANGNTLTVEAPVTNFGSMWDGATETVADLGLSVQAESYGRDPESRFWYPAGPPAQQGLEYDVEKWAASEAEIILTAAPGFAGYDDVVEDAVGNVFYLHFPPRDAGSPRGADAWKQNLTLVGQMADRLDEADAAIARYEAFLTALTERAPADAADREILLQFATTDGTYIIFPTGIVFCDVIAEHGLGQCVVPAEVADKSDENIFEVNAEAVLELDPEWIAYVGGDPAAETSFETRSDPVWSQLSAVAAGQVYDVPDGNINYGSLRQLIWALQDYAHHVWGDEAAIPDPGPQAEFDPSESTLLTGD